MSTPISTAARRIARDINQTPAAVAVYYDAAGHAVYSMPAGMFYADNEATRRHTGGLDVIRLDGRKGSRFGRMTQREAQNRLDLAGAFGPVLDALTDEPIPYALTDEGWQA